MERKHLIIDDDKIKNNGFKILFLDAYPIRFIILPLKDTFGVIIGGVFESLSVTYPANAATSTTTIFAMVD